MKQSSIEALEHINTTKTKRKHFNIILKVYLSEYEKGNKELTNLCVSNKCDLTRLQISRRTGEMCKLNILEFTGNYKTFKNYPRKFSTYNLIK